MENAEVELYVGQLPDGRLFKPEDGPRRILRKVMTGQVQHAKVVLRPRIAGVREFGDGADLVWDGRRFELCRSGCWRPVQPFGRRPGRDRCVHR